MPADAIRVRRAEEGDRRSLALLFAAVAEERDGIAAEPPIDGVIPPGVSCPHRYLPETAAPALPRPRGSSVLGPRGRFEVDQGSVIVPETV